MLNDGRAFESVGVARVSNSFTAFDADGICTVVYGEVSELPEPQDGVLLIVSAMVLAASNRTVLRLRQLGTQNVSVKTDTLRVSQASSAKRSSPILHTVCIP